MGPAGIKRGTASLDPAGQSDNKWGSSAQKSAPAPGPELSRPKVPSLAAQANAWRTIKEDVYKNDIVNATTAAQKVGSRKLMSVAEETTNDQVGKYVLLAQARELAIVSGDPPTAFKCLDDLGRDYDIDYPSMKLDLFTSLSKTVSAPSDIQEVAEGLNRWADAQVRNDRYDAANRACDIALAVAHKASDGRLVESTLQHRKQIAEIRSTFLASKSKLAILARDSNDPAANLVMGQFYCFMKGDWDRGLPMLARGSDARLRQLAKQELVDSAASGEKVAIADAWWAQMSNEKNMTRDRIRDHAVKIYTDVLPNLDGLQKAKVEKRLSLAQGEASGGESELLPCTLLDPNGNKVVSVALRTGTGPNRGTIHPAGGIRADRPDRQHDPKRLSNQVRRGSDHPQLGKQSGRIGIDGGPANGRHLGGAGRTPLNRWVQSSFRYCPTRSTSTLMGNSDITPQRISRLSTNPLLFFPRHGAT